MSDFIDITPSTRILRMLGKIDFSAFQCICELVDNSIDAFSTEDLNDDISPEIFIKVPQVKKDNIEDENLSITITDNGTGMDYDQLHKSLKAGFSSNGPIDKMGLFGMGFNIATARLGQRTEIITWRKNESFKNCVTIDFKELEKGSKFIAPIKKIAKSEDEISKHGTEIRISRLNWEHIKPLRQKARIAKNIGRTYGRIIRSKKIKLVYEGSTCKPYSHCVWSKTRTGKNGVPAIIDIDEVIDTKRYCTTCWTWLYKSDPSCPSCNELTSVTTRERRIKGWIGLQRFFDTNDYGIDLIRNGRVIRTQDKSLFYWKNDASGDSELEYPIDGHQARGRFVGELEIDFVHVTHQKDAFETNSSDWKDVVAVVRGNGPIRPDIAKRNSFPENTTPIARLFSAFRNAKSGKTNLVPTLPGTTQAMISHPTIIDYRNRFFDNETEYQDDDKWWDLIIKGERNTDNANGGEDDDITGGDIFGDIEDENENDSFEEESSPDDDNEGNFEPDEYLSGTYTIDLFRDTVIRVDASRAKTGTHNNGFEVKVAGIQLTFNYWPSSKIFEETFLRPEDLLVNELAYLFFLNSEEPLESSPLSLVERSIKKSYFPDLHPEIDRINDEIANLSRDIKEHAKRSIKKVVDFNVNEMSNSAIKKIKNRMMQAELMSENAMLRMLEKGEFFNFCDLPVLIEMLEKYPQILFDGEFFRRSIEDKNTQDDDEINLISDALGMFKDIIWWQENGTPNSNQVWKGRSRRVVGSLEVIRGWRV